MFFIINQVDGEKLKNLINTTEHKKNKTNVIITTLLDLEKYHDRYMQIVNSLPEGLDLVLITRKNFVNYYDCSKLITLKDSFFNKNIFLKVKIIKIIKKYFKFYNKVFVLDWFRLMNFTLVFKKNENFSYIFAPVISDFGWIKKRLNKIVPSMGIRNDYLRGRRALQDYLTVKLADFVVVQSLELKEFYRKEYRLNEDRIKVNYNGFFSKEKLGDEVEQISIDDNKIKLGFVGNIERHKGIVDLCRIMDRLPIEKYVLFLAGRVKGWDNYRKFRRLREFENVIYCGQLSRKEIINFYNKIDALLLLSYHEGSPRVVREFFEFGKPIFLYDNPGIDYCKGSPGIYINQYGDYEKVTYDIESNNLKKTFNRELSYEVRKHTLEVILREIVSNC